MSQAWLHGAGNAERVSGWNWAKLLARGTPLYCSSHVTSAFCFPILLCRPFLGSSLPCSESFSPCSEGLSSASEGLCLGSEGLSLRSESLSLHFRDFGPVFLQQHKTDLQLQSIFLFLTLSKCHGALLHRTVRIGETRPGKAGREQLHRGNYTIMQLWIEILTVLQLSGILP